MLLSLLLAGCPAAVARVGLGSGPVIINMLECVVGCGWRVLRVGEGSVKGRRSPWKPCMPLQPHMILILSPSLFALQVPVETVLTSVYPEPQAAGEMPS